MGSYKQPTICNSENLLAVHNALQKVEILCGDFEETINHTSANSFFYFDPPYKPLSETSSFNSYAKDEFNDLEQIRLRDFCQKLEDLDHNWMLSNSEVKGKNPDDNFFDDLYANFFIERVEAKRSINANPSYLFLGVTLKGRAIRSKSSLRCGLSSTIPNEAYTNYEFSL